MKKLFFAATWALLVLCGAPVQAALGGRTAINTSASVKPFYVEYVTQEPNIAWTFTTSGLNSGADTVIHVQLGSGDGDFVAGNDDSVGLASSVTVPPSTTTRSLAVIVRSYGPASEGTCTFTKQPSSGSGASSATISFGFGSEVLLGDLVRLTHLVTAQPPGGSADTFLLAFPIGTPSHAVGYDDDDGADYLSGLRIREACTNCKALVAHFNQTAPLRTTFLWDQQVPSGDSDGDGIGPTLEGIVGSSNQQSDSDQDGINDYAELFGTDTSSGASLNFPMMGADPAQKDLYIEADWQVCTDASCGNNFNKGALGWTPVASDIQARLDAIVAQIRTDLAPVRVHVDVGVQLATNSNPNTLGSWNNWGGALRGDYVANAAPNAVTGCDGASTVRRGTFHFAVTFANYVGLTYFLPGSCMIATNIGDDPTNPFGPARVISHEMGHELGLTHGGRPAAGTVNYKMNYPSLMNYAYQWVAPFSHGNALALNPTSLDETVGLGALGVDILAAARDPLCGANGACVNTSTGSVDWNRDGFISPSSAKVQGAVTTTDNSEQRYSVFTDHLLESSMAWVNVGGNIGDRLFILGRSRLGTLEYAYVDRGQLDASCGVLPANTQTEGKVPSCAPFSTITGIVASSGIAFGLGVAEAGPGQLLAVWQGSTGTVRSTLLSVSSNGTVTFGSPVTLPGAIAAVGEVSAVTTSTGVVKAFAPGGNPVRLKQWTYQSGAWTGPVDQQWTDNTFISPKSGIGATMGYQDTNATPNPYAAIPTTPSGSVEFARQETSGTNAGKWAKLAAWSLEPQPFASGRPGLAYQRRQGQANNIGRFYMAFNQSSCAGDFGTGATPDKCNAALLMTEGNLAAGSTRRLRWMKPRHFQIPGNLGGISLLNDLSRDLNLRATSSRAVAGKTTKETWFLPVADGIYNTTLTDQDDYPYLTGALRASLGLDGGAWPQGVLPSNLP